MVNSSNKIYLNRKRGISTIVGGVIFLVLLTAGFSTFFVAMDVQSDTINAQRTISNSIIEKTQEQFSIAVATDDSNGYKLGIQVKNEGPNPIEISNIWIINKSLPNQPVYNIPVYYNDAFVTPGSNSSILQTQHLTMVPDDYDIKVISILGTIQKTELKVGGNNYLLAEMFAIPPDVRINENVTLALRVTNVGPTLISGINPTALLADDVALPHAWINGIPQLVSPSLVPVELEPSESVIFSWQATLNNIGTFNAKIKFSSSATGIESTTGFVVTSNTASDKIIVRDPAGGSGTEIVLIDELFAQPAINMIVPNPAGDDDNNEQALWAVTVANPTDATMTVSKISLTILYAGANSNQEIWTVTDCTYTNLSPASNHWSCSNDNLLVWYDNTSPYYVQSIPPRSAYTFMLTMVPGKTTGGISLDTVVVHAAVFTTLGMFGQATWTSAMIDGGEVIANVYLTEDTSVPYTDPTKFRGSRIGITAGSTETFTFALAELNLSDHYIDTGAQLIINIPKEWQVDVPSIGDDGFNGIPIHTLFPDGSSQIVGVLSSPLHAGGKIITFDAVAPNPACDTMYVMHVLGNGISSNGYQIGPVAEIILQVDAPPPGPVCIP